jgi:hypothetical protein
MKHYIVKHHRQLPLQNIFTIQHYYLFELIVEFQRHTCPYTTYQVMGASRKGFLKGKKLTEAGNIPVMNNKN